MKTMLKVLSLAAILAASAPLAMATPIDVSIGASATGSYTFNPGPNATATILFTAASGEFTDQSSGTTYSPYFATDGLITFTPGPFTLGPNGAVINDPGGFQIATATANGETLTFFITDFTTEVVTGSQALGKGDGYFTETGAVNYQQTNATFTFSETSGGKVVFGATADTIAPPAVPEPSSLMLLGTGLLTAVGVARRKLKA